jgi:hypothetical protein
MRYISYFTVKILVNYITLMLSESATINFSRVVISEKLLLDFKFPYKSLWEQIELNLCSFESHIRTHSLTWIRNNRTGTERNGKASFMIHDKLCYLYFYI